MPRRTLSQTFRSKSRPFCEDLIRWFEVNARDLPWRRTRDPYAIWISEVMLQQTQVKTVVPYWSRWMDKLPDVKALAEADERVVLKLWEGLGYYSRARNLLRAAKVIVESHAGRFPDTEEALLALPGIGRYSAGAIGSIAFNQPRPILDGNVIRVLTRLLAIEGSPREGALNAALWELASDLVATAADLDYKANTPFAAGNCSAVNQALMELGATICTASGPACNACPVRGHCKAWSIGSPEEYPTPVTRPKVIQQRFIAVVFGCKGHYLVRQRTTDTLNRGFWEFPNWQVTYDADSPISYISKLLGFSEDRFKALKTVRHSITCHRIQVFSYTCELSHRNQVAEQGAWVTLEEIAALALTSAHRKIASHLPEVAKLAVPSPR